MSRPRQQATTERLQSGTSGGLEGGTAPELSEFPTQTLFDQFKEKKVMNPT